MTRARRVHVSRLWLPPRPSSSSFSVAWPFGLLRWYTAFRFRSPVSTNAQFRLCESSPSPMPANRIFRDLRRASSYSVFTPCPPPLPSRHIPFPFFTLPFTPIQSRHIPLPPASCPHSLACVLALCVSPLVY